MKTIEACRARWPDHEWRTEPDGSFSATRILEAARIVRTLGLHSTQGSGVAVLLGCTREEVNGTQEYRGTVTVLRTWYTGDAIEQTMAPDDVHLTWAAAELRKALPSVRRSRRVTA